MIENQILLPCEIGFLSQQNLSIYKDFGKHKVEENFNGQVFMPDLVLQK